MTPLIATVVYAIAILGLFWLDRDRNSGVSSALWIPVAWMFIAGSRMVSQWLLTTPLDDTPTQYLEGSPLDRLILAGLLAVAIIVLLNRRSLMATAKSPAKISRSRGLPSRDG